jgi:hypothetical protein
MVLFEFLNEKNLTAVITSKEIKATIVWLLQILARQMRVSEGFLPLYHTPT